MSEPYEAEKVRVLCLDAGMSPESLTYDYLRSVFYMLKQKQEEARTLTAERDALRSAVVRVDQNHKEGSETEYVMYRREKALRAKAEAQLAQLRPALDTLRETVEAYDEGNRRQPRVYEQELAEAARALVALLKEPVDR